MAELLRKCERYERGNFEDALYKAGDDGASRSFQAATLWADDVLQAQWIVEPAKQPTV